MTRWVSRPLELHQRPLVELCLQHTRAQKCRPSAGTPIDVMQSSRRCNGHGLTAEFLADKPLFADITIAGDRFARWARQFHAARQGPSLGKHTERSSRNLCLAGYTTFTALPHGKFLRPTGGDAAA
jgi:hypothetical protein